MPFADPGAGLGSVLESEVHTISATRRILRPIGFVERQRCGSRDLCVVDDGFTQHPSQFGRDSVSDQFADGRLVELLILGRL
jgi:hypothetical protein